MGLLRDCTTSPINRFAALVQSSMNPGDCCSRLVLIVIITLHIVAQSAADGVPFKEAGRRRDKLLEKFVSSSLVSQNVSRVELQTKIREDFTITVKVPIPTGAFATMLYIKVLVGVFNKDSVL